MPGRNMTITCPVSPAGMAANGPAMTAASASEAAAVRPRPPSPFARRCIIQPITTGTMPNTVNQSRSQNNGVGESARMRWMPVIQCEKTLSTMCQMPKPINAWAQSARSAPGAE
jgi:hypothetical protein